ncbi:MAG: DUF481 domain-containing protein [Ignavibacteriaceae bacterium]|nr:DUF481 domain-containing protein [Ignavibacteriaceae bacterium]
MSKSLLLLTVVLLFSASSKAQLTESDTSAFSYQAGVNGSMITGNVERLLIMSSLTVSSVHETWAVRSSNTWQYGTIGTRFTENDLFSRNFVYLYPDAAVYPYLMFWAETNRRRDLNPRIQFGPGVTLAFLRNPAATARLSITLTYENSEFGRSNFEEPEYAGNPEIETWRGTLRLAGRFILPESRLRLLYETWLQQSVKDEKNRRFYLSAAVDVPVSSGFSLRTSLIYNFESVVLKGVKKEDTMLMFGIFYSGGE